MSTHTPEFEDIRAYTDADLQHILPIIRKDKALFDALALYRLKSLYRIFPAFARLVLRCVLAYKLIGVRSIAAFQRRITGYYFFHMLEKSVEKIHIDGLTYLPQKGGALLLSNHRDIVMDPTFIDYALYTTYQRTARLATGDNLMHIPFAHHLMRLNKSFWVKRDVTSPREHLKNLTILSKYIRLSITQDEELVWLAQREGRAKDGVDATDPAVLKMLKLADRRASWEQTMQKLCLIPVSISYEYDPCDYIKACELENLAKTGKQMKDDTASVVQSITKSKGRVAICFSPALSTKNFVDGDLENKDLQHSLEQKLAQVIDKNIIGGYKIFASHLSALHILSSERGGEFTQAYQWFTDIQQEKEILHELSMVPDALFVARLPVNQAAIRERMLISYANTCMSYWRLCR